MDEDIYRRHQRDLIRYATVLVGPSEAEDIVSSVIARLYKSGRSLSDLDEPRPYLMKAVLHKAIDLKRVRKTLPLHDQAIEARESRPEVLDAVMDLPLQQRSAVFFTYWMGMTSEETAAHMGCMPTTVRRYLHLARKKLEGVLADA